jgi:hypothetical protein
MSTLIKTGVALLHCRAALLHPAAYGHRIGVLGYTIGRIAPIDGAHSIQR